jgi:mycoredoxin
MPRESNPPTRITVYATPFCGDTRRARRVLDEMAIPYEFIDLRQNEAAARYVEQVNNGFRSSPTIVFPDGDILVEPADRALQAKLEQLQAAGYDLKGGRS